VVNRIRSPGLAGGLNLAAETIEIAEEQMNSTTCSGNRFRGKLLQPRQKLSRKSPRGDGLVSEHSEGAPVGRTNKGCSQAGVIGLEEAPIASAVKGRRGEQCCHFWIIESARGPISNGVCKWCDDERQFSNYLRLSGGLSEKHMSRLSCERHATEVGTEISLHKESTGGLTATAGVRHRIKTWTYPRSAGSWVSQ
jgi:hypothetical protein